MLLLLFGGKAGAIVATGVTITIGTSGTLSLPAPLAAAAGVTVSVSANLSPPGFTASAGITVGVTPPHLQLAGPLAAATGFRFNTLVAFGRPMSAGAGITIGTRATITPSPRESVASITIDGVDVKGRVRLAGLNVRDILNDAPNTCSLVMEGDGPALGQRLRITVNEGARVLFAGTIQTVDQSFDLQPKHVAWAITAIDDTAAANQRRPFGSWVTTSATTIARDLAARYAPAFATFGIAPDLPDVSITFDGSDTMIAALARLANAVGGYCKIEDGTIYLFHVDPGATPEPIAAGHPFLLDPPIRASTDASQLRTRVYGKGYGENIPADLAAGETLIPIQNGATFSRYGGTAIAATTADGAQWQHLAFTSRELAGGGTLVGPGAAPTAAPGVTLGGGAGVDTGAHTVSVVFVTANGKTLASPPASITVGVVPPPGTAPIAGTALNGTGPDEGTHDYAASFVTSFGETTPSPVSNAVTTSAAVGQLLPPQGTIQTAAIAGAGVTSGQHDYIVTFINAQGETTHGGGGSFVTTGDQLVGQLTPPQSPPSFTANTAGAGPDIGSHVYGITFGDGNGDTTMGPAINHDTAKGGELPQPYAGPTIQSGQTGGNLVNGNTYSYGVTWGNATGETNISANNSYAVLGFGNSIELNVPIGPAGTTKRLVYRGDTQWNGLVNPKLVATINDNTTTYHKDGVAEGARGAAPPPQNTTAIPDCVVNLTNIPIGPAGTTNRKIFRFSSGQATYRYVGMISNNLTQTFSDTTPNSGLGANVPNSNTTGSLQPYNRVSLSNIPIGGAGTTGRRLYRRFNNNGAHFLVAQISNNTQTGYTDTTANSSGAAARRGTNTTGTAVQRIPLTNIPIGPAGVTARKLYRRMNLVGTFKLVTTIANNTATVYTDATPNAGLGAAALATPTAIGNQIIVAVPISGSTEVTSREVYLSPVANQVRRRVVVLADNTTLTTTLTQSDAVIATGPLEPVADTSGLQQPQGQVNPGSTVVPVASAATFRLGGGWVTLAGGQVVRYGDVSGQTLVGIPASGPGSITTTVLYGSQAVPAPMLTGVTGVLVPIAKGSAIHIWVQVDDLQAQAEHAARAGGDGVVEYVLVDTRRGVESLTARCQADLALFARPIVTVSYATRDLKTASGKLITVDLASPKIAATLTIQEVTITEIDQVPNLAPRFTVTASSVRFSLEDTLRRLVAGGPIVAGS